jgi:energy-coupling factor transporter ATP-binding protein EcfA2
MRIKAFEITRVGPIKRVFVDGLADVVVFAGPNGVGKTNIDTALIRCAREPLNAQAQGTWMVVEATCDSERNEWKKDLLDTRDPADGQILRSQLTRGQRRNRYQSSFLNFDSDRAVRNVQQYPFGWDIGNPLTEEVGWDLGLQALFTRYNDVRHSLFRMVEGQKRQVAEEAFALQKAGKAVMPLAIPDVLKDFKDAFWQLLAPKKLVEVNTRDQQIYYETQGSRLSIDTLSSGEREVVNIAFDFILRGPQDCVILFDEPELHLHPELSYKLLQTLSTIGQRNQFLFSTHSPEIISASLENTVVFVKHPQDELSNQALIINRDDQTHHALQSLGQSIGVISLGKKLVLVEGQEASLDKLTYGAILRNRFPEFVLTPAGGKDTIRSFADVRENVLNKTIWGVDFYLLCDRDAANLLGQSAIKDAGSKRITVLPRYHLENYFLDEDVLASAFAQIEPQGSWLRDPAAIKKKIMEIASTVVPYAVALNVTAAMRERVGNVSVMPKGAMEAKTKTELCELMERKLDREVERVKNGLDEALLNRLVVAEFDRLSNALAEDTSTWKADLPGRIILNKFASETGLQAGRLKQLYLASAKADQTFADIIAIFEDFRSEGSSPTAS